jgi:hypothetical protein
MSIADFFLEILSNISQGPCRSIQKKLLNHPLVQNLDEMLCWMAAFNCKSYKAETRTYCDGSSSVLYDIYRDRFYKSNYCKKVTNYVFHLNFKG